MKSAPTPYLVRAYRCLRLALHLTWLGLGAAIVYPLVSSKKRYLLKQTWSHQILLLLNIHLESTELHAPSGCLIVANHISWLDIFAIHSLRPAAFIAKSEVREWPFIGWLAAKNDTVFLRRGSRGHARVINAEIDALLNAGHDVAIFPEGTTTDGTQLLSFHAALLQPAIETKRPILPIAISYHDELGQISTAPSFEGETTLLQCLSAILACRKLTVQLTPLPIIESVERTRREISLAAHTAIAACLITKRALRPLHNQPETNAGLQVEQR